MRTIRHPSARLLPLVGLGPMLAGLCGGPALSAASAAGAEPFAYQHDRVAQSPSGYQHPWGQQDPGGNRYDRPSRRAASGGLPDRSTIHQGKTCEGPCERIRGTREESCREYRC
jgi:hypothetical protein